MWCRKQLLKHIYIYIYIYLYDLDKTYIVQNIYLNNVCLFFDLRRLWAGSQCGDKSRARSPEPSGSITLFLSLSLYIYICICMYICMYIHYICIYIYIYIYICTHVFKQISWYNYISGSTSESQAANSHDQESQVEESGGVPRRRRTEPLWTKVRWGRTAPKFTDFLPCEMGIIGISQRGFSKGGFSNSCVLIMSLLLNPPLLNPPLWTPDVSGAQPSGRETNNDQGLARLTKPSFARLVTTSHRPFCRFSFGTPGSGPELPYSALSVNSMK